MRKWRHSLCILMACGVSVASLLSTPASADANDVSWPIARHDNARTGVATTEMADPPYDVKWRFQAEKGGFAAGVTVAQKTVFAGTDQGLLVALDLSTGEEKWRIQLDSGLAGAPAWHEDRLYVVDDFGRAVCLDASRPDTPLWVFEGPQAECHSAPACDGERVYFGTYDQNLYALDIRTGQAVWTYAVDGPIHGAAALKEGRIYAAGCDALLRALDTTSGTLLWSLDMGSYAAANPAIRNGALYVGHFGGEVLAVDLQKHESIWTYDPLTGGEPFYASCVVTENFVVTGGRDGKVHGLDRKSGRRRWLFPTGGDVDGSPVVAGDKVFVGSGDGTFYVLNMTNGELLWKYVSGAAFSAPPAVTTGRILIGDEEGQLLCFGPQSE
ncbi:PQQ-binding-like beta-propeller repeat protein [bacterium]|nr:PQQ-binding-like beta-propeller repeat protein [bacterium]